MPKPILIKNIEPACITVSMLPDLHNKPKTGKDRYRNTFAWVEQALFGGLCLPNVFHLSFRISHFAIRDYLPLAMLYAPCSLRFIAFSCTISYGKHAFED